MIDAKRLKELMEPEKLREQATHLEACHQLMVARRGGGEYYIDGLDSAAAVLREVAERDVDTDKVIEVDTDRCWECLFCISSPRDGCDCSFAWALRAVYKISYLDGMPGIEGEPAPSWCPFLNGYSVQAKAPTHTQPTQPPNGADIAPNADSGHSGINAAGSDENG